MIPIIVRFKAPIVLAVWFCITISLSLLNKIAFRIGFHYPILLSALHMGISSILANLALKLRWIEPMQCSSEERDTRTKLFTYFSCLYMFNIAFGNISLQIVSLAFSQIVRATIPFATMITSYFILHYIPSKSIILSTIPVCLGVALTVYGNVEFSWFALIILFIGINLSALKGTLANKYLVNYKSMHPIEFLAEISPISTLSLFLFASLKGETYDFLMHIDDLTITAILVAILTGFIAFFMNWMNFLANRLNSPLSMTIVGNIKQVTTVAISIYLFNTILHPLNMLGIVVALLGLALYTTIKYREQHLPPKQLLPTKEPTLS